MLGVDLRSLPEDEYPDIRSSIKPGRLRNLQTGRGVRIGDGAESVRRIMGSPTWQGISKYGPDERVWSYHRKIGTKKEGTEYTSLFRFRRQKVTGIELLSDDYGGG